MQSMQANLVTLETRLEEMLPRMEKTISNSTAPTDDLNEKPATHVNQPIEAGVIGAISKVNEEHTNVNKKLKEKINAAIFNFNHVQTNYQSIHDATNAEM